MFVCEFWGHPDRISFIKGIRLLHKLPFSWFSINNEACLYHVISDILDEMWWIGNDKSLLTVVNEKGLFFTDF